MLNFKDQTKTEEKNADFLHGDLGIIYKEQSNAHQRWKLVSPEALQREA